MYDELVKRLREAPNDWPDADLHYEAADAIEELSKRVPPVPHGRLVDADALVATCRKRAWDEWNKSAGTNWAYAYATFEGDVEDAPTIIPADPPKEEE